MNALVPQTFVGALSPRFAGAVQGANDSLSTGIEAGYGLIRIKGKAWTLSYRGTDSILMREDGDGPRNSIEVVLLDSSSVVSKIWYEQGYTEGSSAAPDCFSTNGVVPHAGASKKQSASCALCPKNAWGSRVTPAGKQGKACSDSRRLAVVPLQDISNDLMGGPLLLRVPAASLSDLATFGDTMAKLGYPFFAIGTRISFDPSEAFPKLVFSAIRPLSDAEADMVLRMRGLPSVTRILAEDIVPVATAPALAAPTVQTAFEQPPASPAPAPVAVAPKPAPAPVAAAPAPVAATPPAPAAFVGGFGAAQPVTAQAQPTQPVATQAAPAPIAEASPSGSDFERDMDAMLEKLLPPAA